MQYFEQFVKKRQEITLAFTNVCTLLFDFSKKYEVFQF